MLAVPLLRRYITLSLNGFAGLYQWLLIKISSLTTKYLLVNQTVLVCGSRLNILFLRKTIIIESNHISFILKEEYNVSESTTALTLDLSYSLLIISR